MLYTTDELTGAQAATRARFMERYRESSQIISVANATAQAQLVVDVAAWFTPSAADPLFVYVQDQPPGGRLRYTEDGSTWVPVGGTYGTSATAGAGSSVTVNHGLPYTPTIVQLQVLNPGSGSGTVASLAACVVWAITATTFTVQSYRRDTDALFANNTVAFAWSAR